MRKPVLISEPSRDDGDLDSRPFSERRVEEMRRPICTLLRTVLGSKDACATGTGCVVALSFFPTVRRAFFAPAANADLAAEALRCLLCRDWPTILALWCCFATGAMEMGAAMAASVGSAVIGVMTGAGRFSWQTSRSKSATCSATWQAGVAGALASTAVVAAELHMTACTRTLGEAFDPRHAPVTARHNKAVAAVVRSRLVACACAGALEARLSTMDTGPGFCTTDGCTAVTKASLAIATSKKVAAAIPRNA
mmetsp:Transcript_71147/g.112688  ORF Transcript_71147/g.112688 Transcript_71147/m.112688 type:complete len:252 (-) Transcript_71147:133-888(-)